MIYFDDEIWHSRLPAGRQKGRFFWFFSSEEKNKDFIGQKDTLIITSTDFTHTNP